MPSRCAAEHDEPWPGGRSNHYLFDMNRDWFAQTQPETRGRIALYPRVVPAGRRRPARDGRRLDATTSRRRPIRSTRTSRKAQQRLVRRVRPRQRARRFDARGFAYFIREVYDSFYPGLRRVVADLPRRDRHDLRAGVGARAALPARATTTLLTYRDGVAAPLHRGDHDGRDRGDATASSCCATSSTTAAARSPRARRARCASTCSCPAPIRRARERLARAARDAGHRGAARRRAVHGRARGRCRPARTSCRRRSRRAGCCATCSTRRSPQPERSSRSRTAAARSGSATRSTTSPRGACRSPSTSRS